MTDQELIEFKDDCVIVGSARVSFDVKQQEVNGHGVRGWCERWLGFKKQKKDFGALWVHSYGCSGLGAPDERFARGKWNPL